MLGSQIEEGRGKRTGRRVIATGPHFKVAATVEENMKLSGHDGLALITYVSTTKPDGSLHGEGEAVFSTLDGQIVTYRGTGVGRFGEGGSISYCGCLSFTTSAPKLSHLNGVAGIF